MKTDVGQYGFHALDGARYLRGIGGLERLVNLVADHSYVTATAAAEVRGRSGELAEFDGERTPLRDALWWADMTTAPDGAGTTVVDRVQEIQSRYHSDDPVSYFIRRAWEDPNAAVERLERRLEAAGTAQA